MNAKHFVDGNGFKRVEYDHPCELLGWYLEQEVQSSRATCAALQSECDAVLSGKKSEWQGTGNAHTVTIKNGNVVIENEFDEDAAPCKISIEEFKIALGEWNRFACS
jgi:uncharacterized protein YacL (UPF0231 family)